MNSLTFYNDHILLQQKWAYLNFESKLFSENITQKDVSITIS